MTRYNPDTEIVEKYCLDKMHEMAKGLERISKKMEVIVNAMEVVRDMDQEDEGKDNDNGQ
jgi:hypothetical protein